MKMTSSARTALSMAACAWIATACGGGDDRPGAPAPATAPATAALAAGPAPQDSAPRAGTDRRSLAGTDRRALAAGDTIDATDLMNWAERTLPQIFPGPQQNVVAPPFIVRFYPATQNYIGIRGNEVLVLGPVSGGQLLTVGTLDALACTVKIETCDAPVITAGPQNASLAAGATATFSAGVGGGPSISYQWLRNDVPIAGANGTTYSFVAQPSDDGARFALQAANAKGTATSPAATLTVQRGVDAGLAQQLASQRGCFSCHSVQFGGIGPAFRAIGARYAGNPSIAPTLVSRVVNGSSGNWPGFGVMTAQGEPRDEVQTIVDWILTLR